ncbi:MAG: hypothetical protein GY928_26065 [Colwellia sp.]|nr:hypothetical protein [Colwellia sp.]
MNIRSATGDVKVKESLMIKIRLPKTKKCIEIVAHSTDVCKNGIVLGAPALKALGARFFIDDIDLLK